LRSPVIDVGNKVVDLVPASVKDLAISWFGTNDKAALLVGIGVVVALYASLVGMLALGTSRRAGRLGVGVAGIAAFGVVGAAAALSARDSRAVSATLPSIFGALAGSMALVLLARAGGGTRGSAASVFETEVGSCRVARGSTPADSAASIDPSADGTGGLRTVRASRRSFLLVGAALASAGAVAAVSGRWLGARFSAAASRAAVVLPRARRPLSPVPAGATLDVKGITPFVTPNADFYRIDTALQVPQVMVDDWRLRVIGMVDRPLELTFDELLAREVVEADITMTCVSNEVGGGLLGSARWLGVRLDDLLRDAGMRSGADQVVGRSVDGYTCGFPVDVLDGRDALVAFGMNGEPLPVAHGFPARLVVPGLYGFVSATKWLTEIELTTFARFEQYWVPRGYAAEAPIKTSSRIDVPRGLSRVPTGLTAIAGVAWAQTRGIERVEVRIDDGPWESAELAEQPSNDTWRQWVHRWEATPGHHTISVRATDGSGAIQSADRSEPLPDGSTGLHQVVVLVG